MPLLVDLELAKGNVLFSQNILDEDNVTIQHLAKNTSLQGFFPA